MTSHLLTPRELAAELRVTTTTVFRWRSEGRIPAEIVEGKVIRFDLAKVREALANRAKP